MNTSLRVLLVAAATSTTGGGERHVADLMRRLPEIGIELGLLCPAGGDITALADSLGVPVYHAPIAAGFMPAGIGGVREAIRAFEPDIVHAHGSRAAMFARLGDARARQRAVYTVHGIHIDKAGGAARQMAFTAIERFLRPRTARFVCVCASDVAKGAALGILDEARASVIHNGIDMPESAEKELGAFRAELGIDEGTPLALSVGRFHEQKDQATLLEAWALVREHVPDAVLALVGAGPLEDALRERAAELQLGESMRFVAPRRGLAAAYADADAFVLSSLWEGLPYVLLEAMAYGLPVASTDVDGIPEAVLEGESGLLVPPADPAALARVVAELLRDPVEGRRMGEAGRDRVAEHFSLEIMAEAVAKVYGQVADVH
jgi:glycosyltransferase involved in cell wall biosynthesis